MKKIFACLFSVALLAAALSTTAMAADKNKGNITLQDTVRVGSTELHAGMYKAEWKQENGNMVKVDFLQHGKVVASAEGTLKNLQQPAPYDAVITRPASDNAKEIGEIDFGKRTEAIVFGE